MKKGTKIIKTPIEVFDTRNYGYEYWAEYCEQEGIEYNESNVDWDFISDVMHDDYEVLLDEISHKFGFADFVVSGYLGLWNGRPRIQNKIFGSFSSAMRACLSCADDYVISYNNWGIQVRAMHHDGTNCFTISPIKRYTDLSDYMIENFNPIKHKRFIQRINCLWE